MSLVIATPAYGNNVTSAYLTSIVGFAKTFPYEWELLVPKRNDSLIQRARNACVRIFLESTYEYLMFIDADIEFTPEDVAKIWNIKAEIKGGIYPFKGPESRYAAWVDGKLCTELGTEPVKADFLGTGFLMIHRSVFEKFREKWPERTHCEGEWKDAFTWFDPRVVDDWYASEDYAFCLDARELGYDIWADPTVRLLHHGSFAYGSGRGA